MPLFVREFSVNLSLQESFISPYPPFRYVCMYVCKAKHKEIIAITYFVYLYIHRQDVCRGISGFLSFSDFSHTRVLRLSQADIMSLGVTSIMAP